MLKDRMAGTVEICLERFLMDAFVSVKVCLPPATGGAMHSIIGVFPGIVQPMEDWSVEAAGERPREHCDYWERSNGDQEDWAP